MPSYFDEPRADPFADLGRLDMLQKAIELGFKLKSELTGQAPGVLHDYFLAVQAEATSAIAQLAVVNPTDTTRILTLQKECAAYAHLHGWLLDRIDHGTASEAELAGIDDLPTEE